MLGRRLALLALCAVAPATAVAQPFKTALETETIVDDSPVRRRSGRKLERAWRNLGLVVRDRGIPHRRRLTVVIDFLERFGPTNPHATNAGRYREALELGHEPVFRVAETDAGADPTLPGEERVDVSARARQRRRARIAQVRKQARLAPPPGLVHLELRLAELHRREAAAATEAPPRRAARAAAREVLQRVLRNHPEDARRDEVHYLLLVDALAEDRMADATKALEALEATDPESPLRPYACYALGRSEAGRARWEEAKTHLARAARSTDHALAYAAAFWLGRAQDALGDREAATLTLRRLKVDLERTRRDHASLLRKVGETLRSWAAEAKEAAPPPAP